MNMYNHFFTRAALIAVLTAFAFISYLPVANASDSNDPPEPVYWLKDEGNLVKLPNGTFMMFRNESIKDADGYAHPDNKLISLVSMDGRKWAPSKKEIKNNVGISYGLVILDKNGELQNQFFKFREVPQKPGGPTGPGATMMIDLYHVKTINKRTSWGKPQRIFEGYCGATLDFQQLRSGRLIIPFAYWVGGRPSLPIGQNISTVLYSDDNGDTWKISASKIISPTFNGTPDSNYGSIEPSVSELGKDGHLWMLMRTAAGSLYESYSTDNGTTWTQGQASRFGTHSGPPLLKRLTDGRIILIWNNCDKPAKYEGRGVYGGRDAIHAAISDDNGQTWKGFREISKDPRRDESPPRKGDRGVAYSSSPILVGKKIWLITGMGEGRRSIVSVDPDWLTAKHHKSDFTGDGLNDWTTFKHFGNAPQYYWRDRTTGAQLIQHPTRPEIKVLHVRRPDEKDPDGAVWNFPNGFSGKLKARIMLNPGFLGGSIALGDIFFNPSDSHGDRLAMFHLPVSASGQLGKNGQSISLGEWHELELRWDLNKKSCQVLSDGKLMTTLALRNETLNGLSYLRLRSTAPSLDNAGYLVEEVSVDIDDNKAPAVTQEQIQRSAANYRFKLFYDEYSPDQDPLQTSKEPVNTKQGKLTSKGYWIPSNVEELVHIKRMGPFIRLADSSLLTVDGTSSAISKDEGKTWTEYPIFSDPSRFQIRPERVLLRTTTGTIILSFANEKESSDRAWQKDIMNSQGGILPAYVVRSVDGGKTWGVPQKLHDEWTGATRDIKQMRNGSIVISTMMMRGKPVRHNVVTYTSKDDGKTWKRSNMIDLGGVGDHAGSMEATIEPLQNGILWMLIRTNWGKFWQAFSRDDGLNWSSYGISNIDASSAPGLLKRLESGRLILVWNRLYPEGQSDYPLIGGNYQLSEVPSNFHRSELSMALSNDDGKTWTKPVVIGKTMKEKTQLAYPYLFESKPGEIWVSTMADQITLKIMEKDFFIDDRTIFKDE